MSLSAPQQARSELGAAIRTGNADRIAAARRQLAEAKIRAHIERVIAEAPPLDDDQLDRLAAILKGEASE